MRYTRWSLLAASPLISERFSGSTLIFTDGSRSKEGTGFGIYVKGQQGFGYRLQEPSVVRSLRGLLRCSPPCTSWDLVSRVNS
jgi:hypothetical protein